MHPSDLEALKLSLMLAACTTLILLVFAPWLAWWLAGRRTWLKSVLEAIVAMPLVLPPTVLGFYFLLAFSPEHALGRALIWLNGGPLVFQFKGLLIASVIYSLPFMVQPLQAAFSSLDRRYLEAGISMGMNAWQRAFWVVLPLSYPSFLSAALLAFVHTLGEFGVVLMIGGNIPGETRVVSIALFDHVEMLDYQSAHQLAAVLLSISMLTLLVVYGWFRPNAISTERGKR